MAKVVVVIRRRNILGAHEIYSLGPGFYVLFEKVVEPVGGRALSEEEQHWPWALRDWDVGLAPFPVGFL